MSRVISFVVLVAVIVVIGALFFRVMASFVLPLFLAALLVVIFRPLHRWMLNRLQGRERLAAGLTTVSVMLIVLFPIALVITLAVFEGRDLVNEVQQTDLLDQKLAQFRQTFDLEIHYASELAAVDLGLRQLATGDRDDSALRGRVDRDVQRLGNLLRGDRDLLDTETPAGRQAQRVEQKWEQFLGAFSKTTDPPAAGNAPGAAAAEPASSAEPDSVSQDNTVSQDGTEAIGLEPPTDGAVLEFLDFRRELLGGQFREWLKDLANPSEQQLTDWRGRAIGYARDHLLAIGGLTAAFLARLVFDGAIMIVGLYFFLVDGPTMTKTVMRLSPLDDRHELELIGEFDRISRAVVVATLLAAVVQGLLAGVGFFFAGLESVFLLTLVTMVLAMVPFVGAAAVWVPVALWLLIEGNYLAGGLMMVYGFAIISAADNVIKPLVLHGQSQLHPMLALLSVLGGVQALGPIGIVVGPLVVAVLQTLLNILHRELTAFETEDKPPAEADDGGCDKPPPEEPPQDEEPPPTDGPTEAPAVS
ncbi:MAG: hypothetical protein CMJ59_04350 [Planctomycetaceae bacterium]|nr:hypothetical protein [Planctomycetaceae bacterium]